MNRAEAANEHETTITLTNDEWSRVMHCIIVISHLPPGHPMLLSGLSEIGRKLGEQCPEGSAPWFGVAGLPQSSD